MGFFSWMTADTNRSISNTASKRGSLTVCVLCPDGEKIIEDSYEGYGVFGGKDIYALFAKWNAPDRCCGKESLDREVGIDLLCEETNAIKFPIKIVENKNLKYNQVGSSEDCPDQGYFY